MKRWEFTISWHDFEEVLRRRRDPDLVKNILQTRHASVNRHDQSLTIGLIGACTLREKKNENGTMRRNNIDFLCDLDTCRDGVPVSRCQRG